MPHVTVTPGPCHWPGPLLLPLLFYKPEWPGGWAGDQLLTLPLPQASFLPSELALSSPGPLSPSVVKGGSHYYSYSGHPRRRAADGGLGEWGGGGDGGPCGSWRSRPVRSGSAELAQRGFHSPWSLPQPYTPCALCGSVERRFV